MCEKHEFEDVFIMINILLFLSFQPKHTQDNFPEYDGSYLILCLSITSGVSRIVCGKIADIPWVSRIRMQQGAFFILGLATLCIPFCTSFYALIGISLIMGLCDGVFVCLLGPIAFDIVGPGEASQAIGFLLGIFSIPFTIGPPVAGRCTEKIQNHKTILDTVLVIITAYQRF